MQQSRLEGYLFIFYGLGRIVKEKDAEIVGLKNRLNKVEEQRKRDREYITKLEFEVESMHKLIKKQNKQENPKKIDYPLIKTKK